ncbi:MAG: DUF2970 domain-containing protein [Cellvibrionaceae bacterium]|nr:DUF2970 domain-containing protein [Cellvibrionaceae bacterium]
MNKKHNKPSFIGIMKSTLAAAFGVQSDKNRQEDFSNSSVVPYIVAGLIFTMLFVFILVGIVYLIVNGIKNTP